MSEFESEIWDREYPSEEEVEIQMNSGSPQIYEEDDVYEDDEYDEEFYEDFIEEYSEEVEEESIVDKARVRLDQGRLYDLLLQHDLFEGVEGDETAIANVQKEIKGFISERLEILLGMRAEKETEVHQIINDPQFNDLEVKVLRRLASQVSKGMTDTAPTSKPEPSELNTVKQKPKQSGLNALSKNSQKTKPAPKARVKKKAKPLRKKSSEKPTRKLKKEIVETSQDGMGAAEIAQRDINYIESLKGKTLEEKNAIAAQRHNRPVPRKPIDQNVVNSHYQTRSSMSDGKIGDLAKIMRLAAMQKANAK